jgi:CheY-like chemotaxis protein
MRLMVVEDNAEVRRIMRRVLSGIATEIFECEDGSEALSAYARWRPDWVLNTETSRFALPREKLAHAVTC